MTTDPADPDATLPPPDDAPLAPGATGPAVPGYEIVAELGRGGMGVVYKARQVKANREVALKVVLSGDHASAAELTRFKAEARAVARLAHPHIVALFEVGEHDGRPFFSMELCPGGTLAERTGGRQIPAGDAALVVTQLARGVAAAHAAGIVHRDLKPQNVLIAADGTPKVTDFGLAKQLDAQSRHTRSGAVLGTPSYMAPEQAAGKKEVGPPADVYALGAILYELLTGRPPFQGPTPLDIIVLVVSEDPAALRDLRPDVPRDLELICLKCLDKDPRRRYPTAAELADDVGRFLAGEPVSVQASGLVNRLAGALDRVTFQEKLGPLGTLLLALAPVMSLVEVWVFAVLWWDWPRSLAPVGRTIQYAAFVAVVGYFRGWRWRPTGSAERHIWAVWGGYALCCMAMGMSAASIEWLHDDRPQKIYQPLACLTALAFFAMASTTWGYSAVIGAAFLALPFVMALDLRFAPLEFGAAWAAVLVLIGTRLRRLGRVADS